MARLSRLALTGAAAVLSGSARAADLPPIPFPPEATSGPAEFGGWYLRGDVGAGVNMTAPELRGAPGPIVAGGFIIGSAPQTSNDTTLSTSGIVDAGAGYQFDNWFGPTRRLNIASAPASIPASRPPARRRPL